MAYRFQVVPAETIHPDAVCSWACEGEPDRYMREHLAAVSDCGPPTSLMFKAAKGAKYPFRCMAIVWEDDALEGEGDYGL